MEKFVKNIKLKVVLIFLIPAIGLLYFSSSYVYQNYRLYNKSLYLESSIEYVKRLIAVVRNLQKERGLSTACLNSQLFCQMMKKQRHLSDEAIKEFKNFLLKKADSFEVPFQDRLKRVVQSLSEMEILRKQIDQKLLSSLEILDSYSQIIDRLIRSSSILERRFIDDDFFKTILSFNKILHLTEINGKERALIAYLIKNKGRDLQILKRVLKLQIESESINQLLQKIMPLDATIIYQKYLPVKIEKTYRELKQKIINKQDFSFIDKRDWWQEATDYIDRLFKIDQDILQQILIKKNQLKQSAFRSLVISFILWLASIAALVLFIKVFTKLLDDFVQNIKMVEYEKKFYQVFSEFSEDAMFLDDEYSLLHSLILFINKTEFFTFTFVIECHDLKVILNENIPVAVAKELVAKEFQDYIKQIQTNKQYIIKQISLKVPQKIDGVLFFPVLYKQECQYIFVAALEDLSQMSLKIVDLIYKMLEVYAYAVDRIEQRALELQLKKELELLSSTFDAHEAIAITDANGRFLKVNKAFEEITGYSADEVIGKTPAILKSGLHNVEFYQKMWHDIKEKGYWKGEIYNKRKDGTIYPEILSITAIKDENGQISHYISHFFDITETKEAQKELQRRTELDLLTELFNRKKMLEELRIVYNLLKEERHFGAFFFIDLDNFKFINDSYGHEIGDKVLVEVAKAIKGMQGPKDFGARIAGDEFALILSDLGEDEHLALQRASTVAQKLLDRFSEPLVIDGKEIDITFSIGITLFPNDFHRIDEIVNAADVAMYSAKKSGKNTFNFYNEQLNFESKQFLIMKKQIEEALQQREFELFFQPKLHLGTTSIKGFEGLMRWRHDDEILTPDKFLPYMKGNRLLYQLTDEAYEQACTMVEELQEKEVCVAINLDAHQIMNRRYMQEFLEKVAQFQLRDRLIIEITEDTLIKNVQESKELIRKMKELSLKVALDDFGVGYSSLSYLREFEIDEIKIDKSFIFNLFDNKNDLLVAKIIEIAKIYDIEVTAEGVESAKSVEFLKSCGCDYIQGFFFSRPVEKNKAIKMVQ